MMSQMATNETDNVHERLATSETTIAKLEHVIAMQAAHIVELSVEDADGGRPSRAQLLAECRVLTRRWAEADAQLEECRKTSNENLGIVLQLRRQVIRLEREMNALHQMKRSSPDEQMHNKQQELVEREEMKTVQRFLTDLATYRGNEIGMPKKLRAALEARIELVIGNARHFSGYINGRTPSTPLPNSCAIVADKVANGTVDTSEVTMQLENDDGHPPPIYHCRATILPFHDP